MGKVYTPKYRVEIYYYNPYSGTKVKQVAAWHYKGKITNKALERYIMDYIESLQPRGINFHVSKALNFIPIPIEAYIVNQWEGDKVVAEWHMPAFQVV